MQDNDNLLASMLARKNNVKNTITLVNSPSYNNMLQLGEDNILVNRTTVTISAILQELRKTTIKNAYSLGRGFGEIWEMHIMEDSAIAGKTVRALDLPASSKICACLRDGKIMYPKEKDTILVNDILVLYVDSAAIRKVEKIIS